MNKVILIGNLTRDPERRSTRSGVTTCSFTSPLSETIRTKTGTGPWTSSTSSHGGTRQTFAAATSPKGGRRQSSEAGRTAVSRTRMGTSVPSRSASRTTFNSSAGPAGKAGPQAMTTTTHSPRSKKRPPLSRTAPTHINSTRRRRQFQWGRIHGRISTPSSKKQ